MPVNKMNILRWIFALVLAALFLFMAHFKFMPEITGEMTGAGNPVFPLLAKNTGVALVEPYFRWITGVMEIITGLLLIAPRTRMAGAGLGLLILLGALTAHFSPFLGIDIPDAGKTIFYMAIGMTVLSLIVLSLGVGSRTKMHEIRQDDTNNHPRDAA